MRRIVCVVALLLFAPIASAWAVEGATKLDVPTAKSLYDKGVVFIDARREKSYNKGHIPDASNLYALSDKFTEANLSTLVAKDKPVVFYCDCGPTCNISPAAANKAVKMGYQNVYFLKAAISGWSEAGYVIEK